MKQITVYLKQYFTTTDQRVLSLSTLFIALSIFINYYHGLNKHISTFDAERKFVSWYFIFLAALSFPYLLQSSFKKSGIFNNWKFVALLLIAPVLFAWKMAFTPNFLFTTDSLINAYWNQVAYWPFKLIIFIIALVIIWYFFDRQQPFYGIRTKGFYARPYFFMLLLMLPLIAAASTQPDFLTIYPKLQNVQFISSQKNNGMYMLLYELAYGTDFISIELYFRGFLILAFAKWVGKDAILPMALFYCTIHFGKPLGECISSFFGGIILGVVTFHTRTIWGGLIVHLGIAWLMEMGGLIGRNL